jgi:DNA polymerase III delta prime subunit
MKQTTFITKYKPYFIEDFCMEQDLIDVIKSLLEVDYLNLLFVGNNGTGKTTLLNCLIREYYGLTKEQSFPENNILFINNLKEQGIQYFRNEMKTFCQSHSIIYGKKKLVVIDDIDSINEHSQQVFRNYIDKYSRNIHFISVCSNVQKVIESLQSRLHIIQLTVPNSQQIQGLLNRIVSNENIQIDEESKQHLLLASHGSIRVMLNYLEKMYIYGKTIDIEVCKNICSNISYQLFETYVKHLKNNEVKDAISLLFLLHEQGYSVIDILDYFFFFIKQTTLLDEEVKYRLIPYLCKYITVFYNVHEECVELALFTNNIIKLIKQ